MPLLTVGAEAVDLFETGMGAVGELALLVTVDDLFVVGLGLSIEGGETARLVGQRQLEVGDALSSLALLRSGVRQSLVSSTAYRMCFVGRLCRLRLKSLLKSRSH